MIHRHDSPITADNEPEYSNMVTKEHIDTASTSLASVKTGEMRDISEISEISAAGSGIIINSAVSSSTVTSPEIGDRVAVAAAAITIASISKPGGGRGHRPVLPDLPYSLRSRKLKIAIIALIVSFDGFLMPTCMFYILKNAIHLTDTRSSFNFFPSPPFFPLFFILRPQT